MELSFIDCIMQKSRFSHRSAGVGGTITFSSRRNLVRMSAFHP
jgi:hypothetical protein